MKSTNELTDQELFDIAWKRANEMTKPAAELDKDGITTCMYRGENGPCLIGAAIPDAEYMPAFEGLPAYLLRDEYEMFSRITFNPYDLQDCHDSAVHGMNSRRAFKPAMLRNLREFARKHNLRIPGEPA